MALEDLVFKVVATDETIYEPERINTGVPKEISITNLGTETVSDIGIYVIPSNNLGDVDYPADYPPETDYQDLIKWGTETDLGLELNGGLLITVPQEAGVNTYYVTRSLGSTIDNLIEIQDIEPNETITITLEVETPPSVSARRLYIGLAINQVS
jgi:hypothetical protein